METLQAELARAKEQARKSDVAAEKALEELRAEQAAHCRSKKEVAEMAAGVGHALLVLLARGGRRLARASGLGRAGGLVGCTR